MALTVLLSAGFPLPSPKAHALESEGSHPSRAAPDPSQTWIELRLPERLGLAQPERFLKDLQAGLDSAGLLLKTPELPSARPPAPPRAVVTVTNQSESILHVRVEAQGRTTPLERTVHLDELPSAGRELALAVLVEELIRAALSPEPALESAPAPPQIHPPASPPRAKTSKLPSPRLSSTFELGLRASFWATAPLTLAGVLRGFWGSQRFQLGIEGSYGRFFDTSTEAGVAHGEVWQVGARGFINFLRAPGLALGPLAETRLGQAAFWSESRPGYEPGRVSGIVMDLGLGARAAAEFGHVSLSLEAGVAMPLAGVVATLDGAPLVDTTTLFGFSSFNLGATF